MDKMFRGALWQSLFLKVFPKRLGNTGKLPFTLGRVVTYFINLGGGGGGGYKRVGLKMQWP